MEQELQELGKLKPLTQKEELFCNHYSACPIGSQAAIKAGYAAATARSTATSLLAKPNIKARLQELDKEMLARVGITKQRVFEQLAALLEFNLKDLYDPETGAMKPIHELEDNAALSVTSVKVYEEKVNGIKVGETTETKTISKLDVLNTTLKAGGFGMPDKLALTDSQGNDAVLVLPKKDIHP